MSPRNLLRTRPLKAEKMTEKFLSPTSPGRGYILPYSCCLPCVYPRIKDWPFWSCRDMALHDFPKFSKSLQNSGILLAFRPLYCTELSFTVITSYHCAPKIFPTDFVDPSTKSILDSKSVGVKNLPKSLAHQHKLNFRPLGSGMSAISSISCSTMENSHFGNPDKAMWEKVTFWRRGTF